MERFLSILLVASTTIARKVVILDDNEWDSVMVTTSPVKITNSRFNPKNSTKDHAIRFNKPSQNSRMMKECEEGDLKCHYDNQLHENSQRNPQDTIEKFLERYSAVTNVKINDELRNSSSKAYWNQIESEKHNHPYDDAKGWVTLDPIPWSSSKVSKWKPNQSGDRPWMYGPPQQHPTSSTLWVTNGPQESNRPSANWGLGSNDIITDNKPNGFPLDNSPYPSRPQPSYVPAPSPPQNPALPHGYQPPTASHYQPLPHYESPTHQQYQPSTRPPYPPPIQPQYPPMGHFPPQQSFPPSTSQPPYQWQQNAFDNYQNHGAPYQRPQYQTSTGHPPNYPDAGQGEWVLLSTTKGYSLPQRYHDRKMHVKQLLGSLPAKPDIVSRSFKSKYQENDIDNGKQANSNRKSDNFAPSGTVMGRKVWNVDGINILDTSKPAEVTSKPAEVTSLDTSKPAEVTREEKSAWSESPEESKEPKPEMTFKRTVRLTVLPALNNTSTFSHDGMLEVDANPQSVEEAQMEAERINKLQQVAVVSTGRQPIHLSLRPQATTNQLAKKRAALIAAVGAGMIPATMAVLLPVALGRRRRSVQNQKLNMPHAFLR